MLYKEMLEVVDSKAENADLDTAVIFSRLIVLPCLYRGLAMARYLIEGDALNIK
jgi:hypothetical protein